MNKFKFIVISFGFAVCYHMVGSSFFPTDEKTNTLQVPAWYIILIFGLGVGAAYVLYKFKGKGWKKDKKIKTADDTLAHDIEEWKKEKYGSLNDVQTPDAFFVELSSTIRKYKTILDDKSKSLDERNAAYLAIRDEEERRLNKAYDFNSIEGINSIPVPCKEVNGDSVTGRVEYYLHKKCFADHWNAGRIELALACLRKAQELMFVSEMIWSRKDFLRLVTHLYEAGYDEEAEMQLKRVDDFFSKQDIVQEAFSSALTSAQLIETDLLEVYSYSPYCKECAKYINRIYSISGKDKRFPSLKEAVKNCQHELRCLSFTPFVLSVHEPAFECKNIIEYSNRPFIDERTYEEIKRYDDFLVGVQQRREESARQEDRMIENAKTKRKDMQTLSWLQASLPFLAPKSLTGFRRMRSSNSKNYQKIVKEARKLGKEIEK